MSLARSLASALGLLALATTSCTLRGRAGKDHGTVSGTVLSSIGGGASGVVVGTEPATGVTATTGVTGAFSLKLPIGVYTLTFTHADYTAATLPDVSVVAGADTPVTITLERTNPLVAASEVLHQAGFGKAITLGVKVTGQTGPVTYSWTQTGGPTTLPIQGASSSSPTVVTGSLADVLAKVDLGVEPRAGLVPVNHDQLLEMTWTFEVTVGDGTFTTKGVIAVEPAAVQAAGHSVPLGLVVIGSDVEAPAYAWTLTTPDGSTATLEEATSRNPWFIPDVKGGYTLTNGAVTPSTVLSIRADEWMGTGVFGCTACHLNEGEAWSATGHATMLQRGLDGILGSHYSEECIGCHTVGYDLAANNRGFDDIAAAEGWEFPTTLTAGNFEAMPDDLKQLANIQCESCHGPGLHHAGSPGTMVRNYSAEVCGTCHQEEPRHDLYGQFKSSGHANLELAMDEATVESRGTTAAHCGRCHSSQGFTRWSQQLLAGNPGNITKPDGTAADVPYLTSLGLTKGEVEPQTCVTCHDPHTLTLRIPDVKVTLPAGYTVDGLGKGTLCISCHNTRNGLHQDGIAASFTAPHVAAQGDVFMGENAYFVTTSQISHHAAIGETCVTCHVTLVPDSVDTTGVNHTFLPDRSICANCHGEGVTGEALSASVKDRIETIAGLASQGILKTLTTRVAGGQSYRVRAWDPVTDLYSSPASTTSNLVIADAPTAVAIEEIHGGYGLALTLPNPVTITWTNGTTSTVTVVHASMASLKDMSATPVTIFQADSVLTRALWNQLLIEDDGTNGIHNPTFVFDVLEQTEAQLQVWNASLP